MQHDVGYIEEQIPHETLPPETASYLDLESIESPTIGVPVDDRGGFDIKCLAYVEEFRCFWIVAESRGGNTRLLKNLSFR